ncbi:MAG: hypothetical protein Q8N76_07790 [Candidatus Omnitrophota bacterium]|nr:hypothetical protein [Candidatus Omnitrophota bacterium]
MNMPLFVNDIKDIGCNVECICASASRLSDFARYIKKKKFDLIAVDHAFPIVFLNELKRIFPEAKLVTGGSGFLDAFLKSDIDFAVIGAGRESFLRLAEALKNNRDLYAIPNLFLKIKKNNKILIDYSGKNVNLDLKKELFPYNPFLKWKYIGFKEGDKINDYVTLVAEFGCPYRFKKLNRYYDNLSMRTLSRDIFTERARKRIKDLFQERMQGGCSFCTYNSYVSLPVGETIDCLMKQVRFLQKKYRFKRFAIGSENPFRFIEKLINKMLKEDIEIEWLAMRSRADWVNKNKRTLFAMIDLAKKYNFKIILNQLGFESLIQKDLDIYNKGYKVTENLKAIKLIRRLKKIAPRHFQDGGGHGMMGIGPWITLKDLKEYLNSKAYYLAWPCLSSNLVLYDRCLPIYQKLKKDGLLVENKTSLDSFRYKDKNVSRFLNTVYKIDLYLHKKYLAGKKSQHSYYKYKKMLMQIQKDTLSKIENHAMTQENR